MANGLKQVKGRPGIFKMKTSQGVKIIRLVEWREDFVFDTIEIIAGAPVGPYDFFANIQGKNAIDTNIATPRRLTSGNEMILNQIGIHPLMDGVTSVSLAIDDYAFICERLLYEFRINGILMAQGPVHCFPSGMGAHGMDTVIGVVSNGLASTAAIPRLLVPQNIDANNDLRGTLTHNLAPWMTAAYVPGVFPVGGAFVRNILRGYMTSAVGKG